MTLAGVNLTANWLAHLQSKTFSHKNHPGMVLHACDLVVQRLVGWLTKVDHHEFEASLGHRIRYYLYIYGSFSPG